MDFVPGDIVRSKTGRKYLLFENYYVRLGSKRGGEREGDAVMDGFTKDYYELLYHLPRRMKNDFLDFIRRIYHSHLPSGVV